MSDNASSPIVESVRVRVPGKRRRVVYQLEWIDCGKDRCKRLHGPYWYLYRFDEKRGKWVSKYLGKERPAAAAVRDAR